MPTTKSDLIEQLSAAIKLPKGKAELIVNVIFDSMIAALQQGERIEIRGFGSFEVREYKAYEGRNPRTGDPVHVSPKRLPFFKVGKELRERVNRSEATFLHGDADADDHDADDAAPDAGVSDGAGAEVDADVLGAGRAAYLTESADPREG